MSKETAIKKIKIKYLFLAKKTAMSNFTEIGILSDNFEYFQITGLFYKKNKIEGKHNFVKIKNIFRKFEFSKNSYILYNDSITLDNQVLYWIYTLQTQINFKICKVGYDQVLKRILRYHGSYLSKNKARKLKHLNLYYIKLVWNKLLKQKRCPWINEEIDKKIKNCNTQIIQRNIYIRLAMYYILIRLYYKNINDISAKRKIQSTK